MRLLLARNNRTALTGIISNLKALSNSITCICSDKEFRIQGLDSSHVCMFDAMLPSEWFDEYASDGEERITIPTAILSKILSICSGSQTIELSLSDDLTRLCVSFTGDSSVCDKMFETPLFDDHSEFNEIPELESDVDMTLPSKDFHELVSQLSKFNETFSVKFNSDSVEMTASGDDGSMTAKLEEYEYAIGEDTELSQSFSLKYVHLMCAFWKLSPLISLEFGDNKPMTVLYDLGLDGKAYIRFHLAPKIDDYN
tara:strand:- start:2269 stop:3033 length:765 start_codon:yes stop_codon:yes gene_type:complete